MGLAGGHLSYWLNVDLEDADWCLLCLIQAERISPGVLAKKKTKNMQVDLFNLTSCTSSFNLNFKD